MHEQTREVGVEARCRGGPRLDDLIDRLQLAEVIAAADGAERRFEARSPAVPPARSARDASPSQAPSSARMRSATLSRRSLRAGRVEREQRHAAADVGADELRMDAVGQDAAAHRPVLAGVQVGHAGDRLDTRERGDLLELARGIALDPRLGRIERVDRRGARHYKNSRTNGERTL